MKRKDTNKTDTMTVRQAGKKGGERTRDTHGPEFYATIGEKGGETTSEKYGPEHYEKIGKKGGETTSREHGPEFYHEIGKKGGRKVHDLVEKGKETEEG